MRATDKPVTPLRHEAIQVKEKSELLFRYARNTIQVLANVQRSNIYSITKEMN